MQASRRIFTLGATLALLSACGGGAARFRAPTTVRRDDTLPSAPNPGWGAWVAAFKGRAAAQGISTGVIDSAFRGAGFLPGVIERDRNQHAGIQGFTRQPAVEAEQELAEDSDLAE